MKSKKPEQTLKPAAIAAWSLQWWHIAAGAFAGALAAFAVYGPALNGPFVFDDQYLPFFSKHYAEQTLLLAIRGVRPLLYFTFWLNNRLSGTEPYTYHLFNVLFHCANSLLIFFITRKILGWAGSQKSQREWLSALAGTVFLLHPVQTEAVAYVASRSENLSALFFYAAFAVFLYRKSPAAGWLTVLPVLVLYGAAVSTKEHTVTLPALLLLTDYFWNPGFSLQGIRRNWRLYGPLAAAAAGTVVMAMTLLKSAPTAGFRIQGLPWHDYFFTQWRALWVYFRLFVFPVGLNADYDYPISRSMLDRGAIFGLAGLLLLTGCALYFRKRYPLAAFGFLTALILFAPTSSVVPIKDAIVERRLYLPMLGLLLVLLEFVRRWRARPAIVAGSAGVVLALLASLCYQRNQVWASDVALWADAAEKSPHNARAHFQLGVAYYRQGRCEDADQHLETASRLGTSDYRLFVDWALVKDCLNQPDQALDKLRKAASIRPTSYAYSLIGMIYGKQKKYEQSLAALDTSLKIDPREDMAYFYRGNVSAATGDFARAAEDYKLAIEFNPDNEMARRGLARAQSRLGKR